MEDSKLYSGHYARQLTEQEMDQLKSDSKISTFQQTKLEKEAKKNWDLFYKRNQTNFFKDRHWTTREFEQLLNPFEQNELKNKSEKFTLFELGCGVGNFFFPLLEINPNLSVIGCDFSPRAIDLIQSNLAFNSKRCFVFVADITDSDTFDAQLQSNFSSLPQVDVSSLIFVLSAIAPSKMTAVLQNAFKILRPGGFLLFRDYGLYDYAQLRFKKGHKIDDNFYVRQDGTRAYYFSEEKLAQLVTSVGFEIMENQYVIKETINRKENLTVPRIFIQGKFRKPFNNN